MTLTISEYEGNPGEGTARIVTMTEETVSRGKAVSVEGDYDLFRFNCLEREMDGVLKFMIDCNQRKLSWVKLSLTVFSIVTTGITALIASQDHATSLALPHVFDALIGIALVAVGLINLAVVRELISIHSSRIVSLRQMNCLRQAMDSIHYLKCEGRYPASALDLRNTSTAYWKSFGRHRKLDIDNVGLRKSERSLIQSPDRIMIYMVVILSAMLIAFPAMYFLYSQTKYDAKNSFPLGMLSGILSALFLAYVIYEIVMERRRLLAIFGDAPASAK
jgi:hypothetical protein